MKVVRTVLLVVGILLALSGLVWFLQGNRVLPGSMMYGKAQWSVNGGIAFIVGVFLILGGTWKGKKEKK